MVAQACRANVSTWLLDHARGRAIVGNGFGASKNDPVVPYVNEKGLDAFVLIDSLEDVRKFETKFPVLGFSPTMTM